MASTTNSISTADDDMAAVFARKAALRKSMLRTLRAMSDTELSEQSAAVAKHLADERFFQKARTVGCYLSMAKGELRTDAIVRSLLADNKALYTPYLPPEASKPGADTPLMHMLRLYNTADLMACPWDKWGILDPGTERHDVPGPREDAMNHSSPDLDVILIPGVAFDAQCNRLGRGKAFYDTFLAKYTAVRPRPLLIALALAPQVIDESVPVTPSDFTLDAVVSPSGIVWREPRQSQE